MQADEADEEKLTRWARYHGDVPGAVVMDMMTALLTNQALWDRR
jgi:hypothetical protein